MLLLLRLLSLPWLSIVDCWVNITKLLLHFEYWEDHDVCFDEDVLEPKEDHRSCCPLLRLLLVLLLLLISLFWLVLSLALLVVPVIDCLSHLLCSRTVSIMIKDETLLL